MIKKLRIFGLDYKVELFQVLADNPKLVRLFLEK